MLALVTTPWPFRVLGTQHFVPTTQRVVVTAADAEHRIIQEIDGTNHVRAIPEGLVLRAARGADLAANLTETLTGIAIGRLADD